MLVDPERFKANLDFIDEMPTLPALLKKISSMMRSTSTSIEAIAAEISKDQVLSAKILRLINSAFYGFPGRISSLTHAIVLLGFDVVRGLVLSTVVFELMKERMTALWVHSLAVSRTAGFIATQVGEPSPEEPIMAGLLHDIGKLIMKIKLGDQYDMVLQAALNRGISPLDAERKLFGFDHADVGRWISARWSLPKSLSEPIAFHHHDLSTFGQRPTAIIALADIFTSAAALGGVAGQPLYFNTGAILEKLSLSEVQALEMFEEMLFQYPGMYYEIGGEDALGFKPEWM